MGATHCLSCGMPLSPDTAGKSDSYCLYCADEQGELKKREEVRFGIAQWLKQWQSGIDNSTALKRAGMYMQAMPAWTE